MSRAGWFSGKLSAVKLCQSSSISGPFGYRKTNAGENAQHLLAHQAKRVAGTERVRHGAAGYSRSRHRRAALARSGFEGLLGFVKTRLRLLLEAIELLADGAPVVGGHRFQLVKQIGQAAFPAEIK